jgi:hypothetical protein
MSLLNYTGVKKLRVRAKELRRSRKRSQDAYKIRIREEQAAKKKK